MSLPKDVPFFARVRHVEEIDPNLYHGDRSNEVNDYLSIQGWILLNVGTHTARGDNGPYSWVYYSVGWIGEGEPQFPAAGSPPWR